MSGSELAFERYFTEVMRFPFTATWRNPDEPGHAEPVTILGVDRVDHRRGILLKVQRDNKQRCLLAEQVWTENKGEAGTIILDDYRYWIILSEHQISALKIRSFSRPFGAHFDHLKPRFCQIRRFSKYEFALFSSSLSIIAMK